MDTITIKKITFDALVERIDRLAEQVKKNKQDQEIEKWLDSQDVCLILSISPRTLQYYRNKRILAYTKIDTKIYYKPEDVERLFKINYHPMKKK